MQKRGLFLSFFSFILGINLVSAFSISEFLDFVDPSTIILGTFFIISLALIHFALSRALRGNTAISAIISLSLSLLIIYGINRFNWDYEGFFFNLGFSSEVLYMVMPAVLLGLIIFLWIKGKLGITLASFGAFLIGVASFTDLVYEKGITNTIGGVLLFLGIWLLWRGRERGGEREGGERTERTERGERGRKKPNPQQTVRTQRELQGKYDQYKNAAQDIVKSVGHHIPKKGTPEYNEWKRNTQAVKAVENIAKKQGVRLR